MPAEIFATSPAGHLHEPFLERATHDGNGEERYALAGFLTLRLADQFAAHRLPPHPDALAYQCSATKDFLREFETGVTEVNHLLEIVRVADAVRKSPGTERMLFPPLLAFAFWLERALRLTEALDVLDTAIRLSLDGVGEEEMQCWLQRGRVLRRASRFDEATAAYATAGSMAEEIGDSHSELLSRVGRGIVLHRLGNLPESEQLLRGALKDAKEQGDHDAEARASHDLANTLGAMERPADAVPLMFQAYLLYEDSLYRLRTLSDLGVLFKAMGRLDAADDALTVVVHSEVPWDVRLNATLELMEVSALRGNQVAFERWRRSLADRVESVPYEAVDYAIKAGVGFACFGNRQQAERHWRHGLDVAERHGLNQDLFRLEALIRDLADGPVERIAAAAAPQPPEPLSTPGPADVLAVVDRVQRLRAAVL